MTDIVGVRLPEVIRAVQHESWLRARVSRYPDCRWLLVSEALPVVRSAVLSDAHACRPHCRTYTILELSDPLYTSYQEITSL